ncbi:hypothetical protein ABEO87_10965 [Geobacillus stearothermophilus]|nr:hypothetical protein DCC82_01205 [Geobacillus sp. LYN3]RDV22513.1 hypothetical protein DXK91_08095 [Parageobacillus toebii]
MKVIQCLTDIEMLKATGHLPLPLIQVIEEQFILFYESVGTEEAITQFRLSTHEAILVLETNQEVSLLRQNILDIEFVEFESVGDIEYYRIGKRNDQEIQLCFAMRGAFDYRNEQWLEEQAMKGGWGYV